MAQLDRILKGVQRALRKAGEDMVITRKVTIKDPQKPTMPGIVTTQQWSCRAYVYPLDKWDPNTMTRFTQTQVIIDILSVTPAGTIGATQQGDIITDSRGRSYKLLDNQSPRFLGSDAAWIHPTGAA